MDQQGSGQQLQDHAAYLAGTHDFQGDIERLTGSDLVGTILETVILATGMRFSGVARVTADRWVACRTVDEVDFGLGLHIAAAIARAHGGGLGVDCDGGITTFTLTLPATPPT